MLFDLDASYSNASWFQARRLLQEGTDKAKKEFEKMDNTKMEEFPDIEEED